MNDLLKYMGLFLLVATLASGLYSQLTMGSPMTQVTLFIAILAIVFFVGASAFRNGK